MRTTIEISGKRVGVDASGTRHWGADEFVSRDGKTTLRKFDVAWREGEAGVLTFRPTGWTMRVAVAESGNTHYCL